MKLHRDPTAEFADLAKTRYQRYVLYRLESSAASSPLRYLGVFSLLTVLLSRGSANSGILGFGWPATMMAFLALLSIGEIYFSRAMLSMLRGRYSVEQKTDQQAVPEQPLPAAQFL